MKTKGFSREHQQKAYQAWLAKYKGTEQYKEWKRKAGEASWAAQNKKAIQRGEFPNQSLAMWGYSE